MTNHNENHETALRIAKEIEAYYNGEMYECTECGETFQIKDGEPIQCECGTEDLEQLSIYDYLSDILDFEIRLDSNFNFISAKIYLTLGGPTIWIDTANRTVNLSWGTEKTSVWFDDDANEEINTYFEEIYNARA
jgi:hypothetical protein